MRPLLRVPILMSASLELVGCVETNDEFHQRYMESVAMEIQRLLHLTATQASHAGTYMINRTARGRAILADPTRTPGKTKIMIGRSAMPIERADPQQAMERIQTE